MDYKKVHEACLTKSNNKRVAALKDFYQTQKGGYGEGDDFLAIKVPDSRAIAKQFSNLPVSEIKKLIQSKFHEERFIGLMILQTQYQKTKNVSEQHKFFKMYYSNRKYVNNWDLVDATAPYLSGHYFYQHDSTLIHNLIDDKKLWNRRIGIISLFYFIRQKDFSLATELIKKRLYDKEDLMHKACGWMLREIGNRDKKTLLTFLDGHAHDMPRTALRYSLEKLSPSLKKHYMEAAKRAQ